MPTRLAVLGAVVMLFAVSGCTADNETAAIVEPAPSESAVEIPAAAAGGACILWDYDLIQQTVGIRFEVAASDQVDDTSSCVVQKTDEPWPDLSLSVVETTKANAEVFLEERMPAKAAKLKGLGRAGYRAYGQPAGEHGISTEIGWLSEAKQLQTLRLTFPKGTPAAEVKKFDAGLLDLAKALSTTNG
ncbi:hypothetical protein [Actinoplanes derwentensis]|uniref:DUF3558 domain-containing protein n=1 Tax=Actinoplanes derwentensis TaxID=113562 RepID=A0A1H2D5F3_9ACTN|nr:hypothetical protein [Actinoplanes derwentensis]GID85300.1 hypothetical protein Ade03nite_42240 [Actinoplanes derwentensis]SDT77988.1 hypothetical protein SAMN04489716_8184 [Actinoplanes derwentensis]